MFHKIPVVNYQKSDLRRLLAVTKKIYDDQIFEAYLTSQQLIVLEHILQIRDETKRQKCWEELMNANLKLNVITLISDDVNSIQDSSSKQKMLKANEANEPNAASDIPADIGGLMENNRPHASNIVDSDDPKRKGINNENDTLPKNFSLSSKKTNSKTVNIEQGKIEADEEERQFSQEDDDELKKLDLDDLNQHINAEGFVGNLALKIRYVLWQCAIDLEDKPNSAGFKNENDLSTEEYVLLNDDNEDNFDEISNDEKQEDISSIPVSKKDDEDDDYDEIDETGDVANINSDGLENEQLNEQSDDGNDVDLKVLENNMLMLTLKISQETLKKLRSNNFGAIMQNWSKIYHSFENDRETVLKRLRLEENDELLESSKNKKRRRSESADNPINIIENNKSEIPEENSISNAEMGKHDGKRPKIDPSTLPVNLGIANLSLKHLLNSIQSQKSKLNITDYELKNLISDVRKNRSKWTSDDRIGQEELYEACEKVVMELRNYTEHSTPFLNKVSKREAPNYHLIIKRSMDLNTVLKKLKAFQYNSKQEFVDDIMLIWRNCLTYNSDPSHYLRTHAIAMQKKSLQLIPMIPNITVRDRAEVEKELAELDKDKDYKDETEGLEEIAGSGRKGLNMGAHKPAGQKNEKPTEINPKTEETMPLNETDLVTETDREVTVASQDNFDRDSATSISTPDVSSHKNLPDNNIDKLPISNEREALPNHIKVEINESQITETLDDEEDDDDEEEDDDDEEEDDEDEIGGRSYFIEQDDDRDDLELTYWKTATAKVRAEICLKRRNFFRDGHINPNSEALLKNPQKLKPTENIFEEYKAQKEMEALEKKLERDSVMKNGFGTNSIKEEDTEPATPIASTPFGDLPAIDKTFTELDYDNATLLQEYDSSNCLPELAYKGMAPSEMDKEENDYMDALLKSGDKIESPYLKNINRGMTLKLNQNIRLIQQIRHICHKISLIRILQNPQYMQNNKISNDPNTAMNHRYRYDEIDDYNDLDPISQLNTHNYKNDKQLMWQIMRKIVGKISMANGFEATQPTAVNMLTEITSDYICNLIKSIKLQQESNTVNKKSDAEILKLSLLNNGINLPDSLYSYAESEFVKKTKKLREIKQKLENFLKDLLRPTLKELSDRNFEDSSEDFVTGNFATELTGEDFFGFKELGLDKEFGVLSSSVPIQLLTSQFQAIDDEQQTQEKKIQQLEVDLLSYSQINQEDLEAGKYLGTLKGLLTQACTKSKIFTARPQKGALHKLKPINPNEPYVILDDETMILKKAAAKLRLPPTGKISTSYKKKSISNAFFIPQPEENINVTQESLKEPSKDSKDSKDSKVTTENTSLNDGHVVKSTEVPNPFSNDSLLLQDSLELAKDSLNDSLDVTNNSMTLALSKVE